MGRGVLVENVVGARLKSFLQFRDNGSSAHEHRIFRFSYINRADHNISRADHKV